MLRDLSLRGLFGGLILLTRVSRRAIYSRQGVWRVSVSLAELRARDRCAVGSESSSLQLIGRFRAGGVRSSRIDNGLVSFYSLVVATSVKFTSLVTMEIKYNVRRMSRKQVA